MKPAAFRYHAPKTVEEAVAILQQVAAADADVLAGGRSLIPKMAFRLACRYDAQRRRDFAATVRRRALERAA